MSNKWFSLLTLAFLASPASAVCFHGGTLYAKTTIAQEFTESRWVVRARVESGHSDFGSPTAWTLYRLRVVEAFKGTPPKHFDFYTQRNSGGFYMDGRGGRPDASNDYLLFLKPTDVWSEDPPSAKGTMSVNYECGQSKPWAAVSPAERATLLRLGRRRR